MKWLDNERKRVEWEVMEASLKNESLEGMKVVWDGNCEVKVDWEIGDEGGRVEWEVMFIS